MQTKVRLKNDVIIIEPVSRLIGTSIVELRDTIYTEIGHWKTPRILFDFHRTRRIDSGGLGVLLSALATVKQREGSIGVMNLSKIQNLLMKSHILRCFEHYDEENAAVSCMVHAA
ncbi:STAS domain-containing protein [Candidatus Poribacteria bacterium]|nr:STAS domain-containing protein [Candidatus Poribacteria bacterium]MYF55850.1 STAS domain-containing protein [Candidatus Poribacteria bacterium]MYI94420.1 STAS domain-containing protein [Candidatus Poribacteria bacterium]